MTRCMSMLTRRCGRGRTRAGHAAHACASAQGGRHSVGCLWPLALLGVIQCAVARAAPTPNGRIKEHTGVFVSCLRDSVCEPALCRTAGGTPLQECIQTPPKSPWTPSGCSATQSPPTTDAAPSGHMQNLHAPASQRTHDDSAGRSLLLRGVVPDRAFILSLPLEEGKRRILGVVCRSVAMRRIPRP